MKKRYILFLSFIILFLCNNILWASPINENIIKYRYYITTILSMPEFKDDFTLPFENDMTKIMLNNEVQKTSENYEEVLNYIDCKSSAEVVIYQEYLKQLKEILASKGIFSNKFNELRIDSNKIYTPIFDIFSFGLNKNFKTDIKIPENVQKTQRLFPYLYSVYFKNKNINAINNLLKNINLKEDNPNDAQYYYNEAVKNLIIGYSEYCNENYRESCKGFENSIPYWRQYYILSNVSTEIITYLSGLIKLIQGTSAIEYDYEEAKEIYEDSLNYFTGQYSDGSYYSHAFIAEIYYRQNDIKKFINYMDVHIHKNILRENIGFSTQALVSKMEIMNFEYVRLSNQNTYYGQSINEFRNKINERIKNIENSLPNDSEGRYTKKILSRYKEIMNKNSIEIRAVGFSDYSASEKYYVNLKNHAPDELIKYPQWRFIHAGDTVSVDSQPIAAVRNNKIKIQLGVYTLDGLPSDIINNGKLVGIDKTNNINFNMIARINKDGMGYAFESDREILKTVGTIFLDIDWHLIIENKRKSESLIKDFCLGNTKHTLYIVRKYIEEPCYWQIVDHTCNWLKNLSESDLGSDDNVVDAIWNGCSIESLTNLGYWYKYPPDKTEETTLRSLLETKHGECGQWASFLIYSLRCANIEAISNFKKFQIVYNGELTKFKYYDRYPAIGYSYFKSFDDHVIVGYKGNYNVNEQSFSGLIYDPVFHIKCFNKNTEYEDMAVEYIQNPLNSVWEIKQIGIKQFNFRLIDWKFVK